MKCLTKIRKIYLQIDNTKTGTGETKDIFLGGWPNGFKAENILKDQKEKLEQRKVIK